MNYSTQEVTVKGREVKLHHHGPVQMLANKLPLFARYQQSYQSDDLNDCISKRSRGAAFLFSSRYLGGENKRPEVQLNAMCVSIAEGVSPARQDLSVAKTKLKQQLISTEIKSQGTCKLQAVLLSLLRGPLSSFVVVVFFLPSSSKWFCPCFKALHPLHSGALKPSIQKPRWEDWKSNI